MSISPIKRLIHQNWATSDPRSTKVWRRVVKPGWMTSVDPFRSTTNNVLACDSVSVWIGHKTYTVKRINVWNDFQHRCSPRFKIATLCECEIGPFSMEKFEILSHILTKWRNLINQLYSLISLPSRPSTVKKVKGKQIKSMQGGQRWEKQPASNP